MTSLDEATKVFLDTAPLIYLVEKNERYWSATQSVFGRIDAGALRAVTSAISLAECLVLPYRKGRPELVQVFTDLIVNGENTDFVSIDQEMASKAAEFRARYNLLLSDAFQAAAAFTTGCDLLLTNDADFKRISELDVLLMEEVKESL